MSPAGYIGHSGRYVSQRGQGNYACWTGSDASLVGFLFRRKMNFDQVSLAGRLVLIILKENIYYCHSVLLINIRGDFNAVLRDFPNGLYSLIDSRLLSAN